MADISALFLQGLLDLEGRHYGVDSFCWLCQAAKYLGPICAWTNTDDAAWLASLLNRLEFMASRLGVALTLWPEFHLLMVLIDLMHCLALGIYHWEVGACLYEFLELGRWRIWSQSSSNVEGGLGNAAHTFIC